MRMPEYRIPKQVFFGQLASGKRPQCGPARRYKDTLGVNLKQCKIDRVPDQRNKRPLILANFVSQCSD